MREHKSKFHLIDLLQQSLNAVCSVFMLIGIALFSELELRVILYQGLKKKKKTYIKGSKSQVCSIIKCISPTYILT